MRGKLAKRLRTEARKMAIAKPGSDTYTIYKQMKATYKRLRNTKTIKPVISKRQRRLTTLS